MNKTSIIVPVVVGLLGLGIGASVSRGTAEPLPAVTKTTTATVTATPPTSYRLSEVCKAAFTEADVLIDISAEMAQLVSTHLEDEGKAWTAMADYDLSAIEEYSETMYIFKDNIADMSVRVAANRYAQNRDACLGQS